MPAPEAEVVIRARSKGQEEFKKFNSDLLGIQSTARKVAGILGAAGLGAALGRLTKAGFESGDALAKMSDKLGITTEKLAAYQLQAKLANVSSEALDKAFTQASKRAGEFFATGGGTAGRWIEKLGLDIRELVNLSPDQLFQKYAEAIRGLNSRGEQLSAVSDLMGDRSGQLINIIDEGADSFAEAERNVDRFGLALSRVDAAKIEQANDAMTLVQERARGMGLVIASKLAPVVTALANRFIETGQEADQLGATVDRVIDGMAVGVGIVADALWGWKLIFAGLKVGAAEWAESLISQFAAAEQAALKSGNFVRDVFGMEQIDPSTTQLGMAAESMRNVRIEAQGALDTLAASERPSVAIAAALQQARVEAHEFGEAAARAREKLQDLTFTDDMSAKDAKAIEAIASLEHQLAKADELRSKAALKESERLIQETTQLRESLASDLLAIQDHLGQREIVEAAAYLRRQEVVQLNFDNKLISEEQRLRILEDLEDRHQETLTDINLAGWTEREKFLKLSTKHQAQMVFGHLEQITAGVANSNRTMFNLNKAAAIGNAIINTQAGMAKMLDLPFPLNFAMVAAVAAAGAANILAIKSAQFGGGTTPSFANTPTVNNQPVPTTPPGAQPGGPQEPIIIVINGAGGLNGPITRDDITEVIRDQLDNGDAIMISSGSRQMEEIKAQVRASLGR